MTAAYGNILPQAFLDIPTQGTLNIHPSLLPQYRGAAPVQRALQVSCQHTSVPDLVVEAEACIVGRLKMVQQGGRVVRIMLLSSPPSPAWPDCRTQCHQLGGCVVGDSRRWTKVPGRGRSGHYLAVSIHPGLLPQ